MISIVITAYKEPKTIGLAIKSFLDQDIKEDYELIVIAPDNATLEEAKRYQIKTLQDPGKGKPAALNMIFKAAKGDILILSDGDVYVGKDSVNSLIKHFKDKEVGAVTGHPVSTNNRDSMMGYWSHLLVNAAHKTRQRRKGSYMDCSGYLYAIRNIIDNIPEEALADDALISQIIWKKGHIIVYEPKAFVNVKYPNNFKDWILQKKRSAGGHNQLKFLIKDPIRMRSFKSEFFKGWIIALSFPRTVKEMVWTICLFIARLYLWILIFIDVNIKKKSLKVLWKRVESTK